MKNTRRNFLKDIFVGVAGISIAPSLGSQASKSQDKCKVEEKEEKIIFCNDMLALTFDRFTGRWLDMIDLVNNTQVLSNGSYQAPIMLSVNGTTTNTRGRTQWWSVVGDELIGNQTACSGYHFNEKNNLLTIHTYEEDWLIDQEYKLIDDRLERGIKIEYLGEDVAILRGVEFRIPPVNIGPVKECFVEAPGYPTKAHQPLTAIPYSVYWDRLGSDPGDAFDAPGWKPGLLCIDNPTRDLTFAACGFSQSEPSILQTRRGDQGTQIIHTAIVSDRFTQGHSIQWKGQYIWLSHQSWQEFMNKFQFWYQQINLPALNTPKWAKSARIYELFIGERANQSKYPDFDALIKDLPRIKDLGFDTLQIMPHQPFPSYRVFDYYDVDTQYGSAKGLKRLIARAHKMGMKVLLDVILHGVIDQEITNWHSDKLENRHLYRKKHPEWFMKTEFGTPAATYTWSFDHANQSWQNFMVGVFKHYVSEYDVDGFRVDALTWNLFPNWAEGLPYRASESIYASADLMKKVDAEINKIKPDVVLYSETTGPLYANCCHLSYNYDMQWIFSSLVTPVSQRGFAYVFASPAERIEAADLGPWLTQHKLARPKGAMTIHHLDSHDTHSWGGLSQYRSEAFGEAASRALFALCCVLDGGIMVYQGAEDTAVDYYKKMLGLFSKLPALKQGSCEYEAIRVDNRNVFTVLRIQNSQVVIPVINIADKSTRVNVDIPIENLPLNDNMYQVVDHMEGLILDGPNDKKWNRQELARIKVDLNSYQTRILEIVSI